MPLSLNAQLITAIANLSVANEAVEKAEDTLGTLAHQALAAYAAHPSNTGKNFKRFDFDPTPIRNGSSTFRFIDNWHSTDDRLDLSILWLTDPNQAAQDLTDEIQQAKDAANAKQEAKDLQVLADLKAKYES